MAVFLNVFLYMIPSKTDPGGLFSAQFIWSQRAMPRHLAPTHRWTQGTSGATTETLAPWALWGGSPEWELVSHRHITCGAMCVYVYIYIHTHTLIHVSSCTCMHACIYIYMYTHVTCYMCIYIYIFIYLHIYICIHMHMYIYIHMHMHMFLYLYMIYMHIWFDVVLYGWIRMIWDNWFTLW